MKQNTELGQRRCHWRTRGHSSVIALARIITQHRHIDLRHGAMAHGMNDLS